MSLGPTGSPLSANDVISLLGLEPHPEGGHYTETFRDGRAADGRGHSSAIYFLLSEGQVSHWHRIDAAEVWHWYAGAPLEISTAREGEAVITSRLGPSLQAGERPRRWCRGMPGKAPGAWAHGAWLDAPWRPHSTSTASSLRPMAGRPAGTEPQVM